MLPGRGVLLCAAWARLAVETPKWFERSDADPCFPQEHSKQHYRWTWKKCCSSVFGPDGNPGCWADAKFNYERCCIFWPGSSSQGLLPIYEDSIMVGLADGVLLLHQDIGSRDHLSARGVAVLYPGGYALGRWLDACAPARAKLQILELAAGVAFPSLVAQWRWQANVTASDIQARSLRLLQLLGRVPELKGRFHARRLDVFDRTMEERFHVVMAATVGCEPEVRAAAVSLARRVLRPCGLAVFLEGTGPGAVIRVVGDELFGPPVLHEPVIAWDRRGSFQLTIWQNTGGCKEWPWGPKSDSARPGCLD